MKYDAQTLDISLMAANGEPSSLFGSLKSATIVSGEGLHDVIMLHMINPLDRALVDAKGSPARFRWSWHGSVREMVGYIDTTSPHRVRADMGEQDPSIIYMFGASYSMNVGDSRAWRNTHPLTIATEVISPYCLGLEMDEFSGEIASISQTGGESDWTFLRRLAEVMGYSLVPDETVVRFIDPFREMQRSRATQMLEFVLPSRKTNWCNVDRFTVRTTDTPVSSDHVDRVMLGRDNDGQQFMYSSEYAMASAVPGYKARQLRPSEKIYRSLGEAVLDADRIAQTARWDSVAVMEVPGDPRLRSGTCALVSDVYGPHSGLWYVSEVRHDMTQRPVAYKTTLTLCRESLGRRQHPALSTGHVKRPAAKLTVDGRWQSSKLWVKQT